MINSQTALTQTSSGENQLQINNEWLLDIMSKSTTYGSPALLPTELRVCKHKPWAWSFIYVLSLTERNPEIKIAFFLWTAIITLYNGKLTTNKNQLFYQIMSYVLFLKYFWIVYFNRKNSRKLLFLAKNQHGICVTWMTFGCIESPDAQHFFKKLGTKFSKSAQASTLISFSVTEKSFRSSEFSAGPKLHLVICCKNSLRHALLHH